MNRDVLIFHSIDLIENRISQKLSIENISNSIHFSPYHYGRLFREVIGVSVMNYVTKRKLTITGNMLLQTNKTILDIAFDFGLQSAKLCGGRYYQLGCGYSLSTLPAEQ